MSSKDPYKPPSEHEPKKSNTALIVIIVLAVLTIPALCICGGAAAWLFLAVPVERNIEMVLPDEAEAVPMTETVPPIQPVPPVQPAPSDQPVPPIPPATGDEPRSGDDANTK